MITIARLHSEPDAAQWKQCAELIDPTQPYVPRELVREVARPLRAERRSRGTRKGSRALTCWFQALLGLAWFRNQGEIALVGAGFGVSRATAYRYRDEVIAVLAAQAPDPHDAVQEVAEQGWSHEIDQVEECTTDNEQRGDRNFRINEPPAGSKIPPVGACGVVQTPRFNGKQE